METKPQAQSFPVEEEAVACDQSGVANSNAKQCKEMVPEIAVPMEEEGMAACVQRVAIAKQCREMGPEGAVPKAEEVVPCAQGMVITEQGEVMSEPHVAVLMQEEASARDQGEAEAKQCKETESKFTVTEEGRAAVVCSRSVVIAEPCTAEMKSEVAVPMEEEAEEAVACDQADTVRECKVIMESKGAVPMDLPPEEEVVACDQQVPPDVVPLLAPRIAKLCKELDPEAVILKNDVYLTIEDCTGKLSLPLTAVNGVGDGDGDDDGKGDKSIVNGIINGCKATEPGLTLEPVSEPPEEICGAPEPSWGDVPDEPVADPVTIQKTPRSVPKRQRPAPENVEVDDVVQTMRNILMDLRNVDDARLHPDDDAKVRSLLEYHPQAQEKMGSGIDYIKIKRHSTFKDVRCFWVVRTDGTETDFSYHKCLKEKVVKDHPSFVDRYDAIYRAPKRPRQA